MEYKNPTDLIGKTFRRNVYGLSIWTDTVADIKHRYKIDIKNRDYKNKTIEFYVVGKLGDHWYDMNEIVIVKSDGTIDYTPITFPR